MKTKITSFNSETIHSCQTKTTIRESTAQALDFNCHKLLKNLNFQIVEKSENSENSKKDFQRQFSDKNKNVINILANNENTAGAFFSVSVTIYSQQSILPQFQEALNKDNKILTAGITEIEEIESPECKPKKEIVDNRPGFNIIKMNSDDFNDRLTEGNKLYDRRESINMINQSGLSMRSLLEMYNINSLEFNDLENKEKLATLELCKEDIQKLEAFFKERNNLLQGQQNNEHLKII